MYEREPASFWRENVVAVVTTNFSENVVVAKTRYQMLVMVRDWSKSIGGVGWSREGVGHEALSLVQGVGRAIFSYP